jgi:hypothetical protein
MTLFFDDINDVVTCSKHMIPMYNTFNLDTLEISKKKFVLSVNLLLNAKSL